MDQERGALDKLRVKLDEHFQAVQAVLAKILELANAQDVDNSDEIATLTGEIQATTEAMQAALQPVPPG